MNTKSVAVVIVAVLTVVIVWTVASCSSGNGPAGTGTASGSPASLTGTTLDGRNFDLAQYRGRPVVINFFAEWCPPCNMEAPDLAEFARAHPEVGFVGVDTNDRLDRAKEFVRKYGLPYPVVFDPQGAIGQTFNVDAIPTTFFLDAQGVVRATIVGAATREAFEAKLQLAQ